MSLHSINGQSAGMQSIVVVPLAIIPFEHLLVKVHVHEDTPVQLDPRL